MDYCTITKRLGLNKRHRIDPDLVLWFYAAVGMVITYKNILDRKYTFTEVSKRPPNWTTDYTSTGYIKWSALVKIVGSKNADHINNLNKKSKHLFLKQLQDAGWP